MKLTLALLSLGLLALGISPAVAQKQKLAIVLGGLDNPFFQEIVEGCAQWTADHPDSPYECVATGPDAGGKPADQLKLIKAAIEAGAVAIGVAPATEGIPKLLKDEGVSIPVITVAGDFAPDDQALRKSWVTADDYVVGVELARMLQMLKPDGGTLCLQLNTPEARNINARAAGTRDTLAGKAGTEKLTGENGWTEVKGCPLYAKDDVGGANKQLAKLFANNPKIDAVILQGGWAMFDSKAFAKTVKKVQKRLANKSLVLLSADALPPQMDALRAGSVHGLVAPLPFQLGVTAADALARLAAGETVPAMIAAPVGLCTADTADTCTAH